MTKVNTYGMKMHGLKAAAGVTRGVCPSNRHYVQISYNEATGDIYADWHVDCNSWTNYYNAAIFDVTYTPRPLTMQQIADAIAATVAERAARRAAEEEAARAYLEERERAVEEVWRTWDEQA